VTSCVLVYLLSGILMVLYAGSWNKNWCVNRHNQTQTHICIFPRLFVACRWELAIHCGWQRATRVQSFASYLCWLRFGITDCIFPHKCNKTWVETSAADRFNIGRRGGGGGTGVVVVGYFPQWRYRFEPDLVRQSLAAIWQDIGERVLPYVVNQADTC